MVVVVADDEVVVVLDVVEVVVARVVDVVLVFVLVVVVVDWLVVVVDPDIPPEEMIWFISFEDRALLYILKSSIVPLK